MIHISKYAQNVKPSTIRNMFNLSQGIADKISFALGEPDFSTPTHILKASIAAINNNRTKYTANAGVMELRQAIAESISAEDNVPYNPGSEIVITAGAMEALMLAMMVLLNPDDEVIISNPCWTNYPQQIAMCGSVPVFVSVYEKDGFLLKEQNVRNAITKKTRAILINSPGNPTGGVYDLDTLRDIADIAKEHDLFVISDEVYKHIIYDGLKHRSIAEIEGMKDRTVVINSFSKSYAMTGWRVGYAAGNAEVISNMIKYQENLVACVATPSQYAAIQALKGPQDDLHFMRNRYAARRDLVLKAVDQIEGLSCVPPKGTFYAFINIEQTGLTSEDFAMQLLEREHVVVIPGSGFGSAGEGFIRISYATSEDEITEGMRRIKRFVERCKAGEIR